MRDNSDNVIMWTSKEDIVIETLERDGISFVKKEYIDKKYGETAWIFRTAYSFFCKEAEKRIPKPEQAESPIWIFADEEAVFKSTGNTLLKLSVPKEEIIFFDLRDWNKILNLCFLGSEEEENEFRNKLKSQGIKDNLDIINTPFYPLLKKELMDSWKRLFDKTDLCKKYTEGAVWQLKQEWVIEKYIL